ncbi:MULTISPECIES: hypothetical protein [unclassified Sporosarcina]|uniref:hypothetical protein n=1 Tax=unclassified Sporosarcina TaxID=2647733 RepID=UPI00203F4DEF|nr:MULTISPECIES: hypothetical protein [unclassified Sporosarcina]GKV64489.1 hypothetical protein NCCP2331_06420 [Sporosarcina sp. NCCP-2331]GLB57521.1 hypothetical protein NCCP2378_33100 [Sporosarcina sp. NCCP-2378]
MTVKRISGFILLLLFFSSIVAGCSTDQADLEKVKGEGLTFSEYFKSYDHLDERERVNYYKPIPIIESDTSLSEKMKTAVKTIDLTKLPFQTDEQKVYLVTSKDENGNVKNQVQLSYFGTDEYGLSDDFFIVSVTEADKNPLESYDSTEKTDSVGNEIRKEQLTEDLPVYQQVLATDSALLYRYYEETDKGIAVVGTAANEFYAYYEGHIYHIGYSIDKELNDEEMQEKMLQLVREYITASAFPQ